MLKKIYGQLLYRFGERAATKRQLSKAHRCFHKSAKLGNSSAQFKIGLNYRLGIGCLRSGSEALLWLERAALAGNVDAQFEVGVALLSNRDEAWCVGSAANWISKQSSDEKREQQKVIFPHGFKIEKDEAKAFKWIMSAAEAGKPEAQSNLGWLYINGIGCATDILLARTWLEEAAKSDIPSAVFGIAELHGGFAGHPVDRALEFTWLERAADLGHVTALYNLGRILISTGTDEARQKAIGCFKRASEKNHALAAVNFAKLLLTGNDRTNIGIAEEKLRLASKLGNSEAPLLLGHLYNSGTYRTHDYREAFVWFKIAADRGNPNAQFRVACMYAQGRGVTQDLPRSIKYFSNAAGKGHGKAAFNLGIFFEKGEVVQQDREEACKWFRVAMNAGVGEAKVCLARSLLRGKRSDANRSAALVVLESAVCDGSVEAEFELAQFLIFNSANGKLEERALQLLLSASSKGSLDASSFMINLNKKNSLERFYLDNALISLERHALGGSIRAQLCLAEFYDSDILDGTSNSSAERWLLRAAFNDSDDSKSSRILANFKLGVFYCKRNLRDADIKAAILHYTFAAHNGHALSQYNLGVMHLNGIGVSPNSQIASDWFSRYLQQGYELDKSLLEKIEFMGTGMSSSGAVIDSSYG